MNQLLMTEPQQKVFSKLCDGVKKAREHLEIEQAKSERKGLTYVQKREETKLRNAETKLNSLDDEFQRRLDALRKEFDDKRRDLEQKIKNSEQILGIEEDTPAVVDAKIRLDAAIKKKNDFMLTIFPDLLTPSSTVTAPAPPAPEPEKNTPVPPAIPSVKKGVKTATSVQNRPLIQDATKSFFARQIEEEFRLENERLEANRRDAEREIRDRERQEEEKKERDRKLYFEQKRQQEEADRQRQDALRQRELSGEVLSLFPDSRTTTNPSNASVITEDEMDEETFLKELQEAKERNRIALALAPVPPPKPKKGVKMPSSRKPVKEVGPGVVLYQQPQDD